MNRLKELRLKNNLTLEELELKLHISKSSLSRFENGEREPKESTIRELADFYNVSIDYLMGRDIEEDKVKNENNIVLDDFQFALYDKVKGKDLSDKQKKDILNIIDALKKSDDE